MSDLILFCFSNGGKMHLFFSQNEDVQMKEVLCSLCFKMNNFLQFMFVPPLFLKEFRTKSREWDKQEILYQTHLVSLDAQQKLLSEKCNQFQVH